MTTKAPAPLEKTIEAKFVRECKKRGWLCLKQNVIGRRGYPDRLVITSTGVYIWVELKRVGGVLSENQKDCIQTLKNSSCIVVVCYSAEEAVAAVLRACE